MSSSDRISFLEGQLFRLQSELENERTARQEAASQVQALIGELQRRSSPPTTARRFTTPPKSTNDAKRAANTLSAPQHSTRTVALSPNRGADLVRKPSPTHHVQARYATPPRTSPIRSTKSQYTPSGDRSSLPSDNKFATPRSTLSRATPTRAATPSSAKAKSASAADSVATIDTTQRERSGLELAWDAFASRVQVLSANELALVTAETLTKLLDTFAIVDEMERAKIEAQWSIFQREADELVGRFGRLHKTAFEVRPLPATPKLSRRTPLEHGQTPTRSSNPNEAGGDGSARRISRSPAAGGIRTVPSSAISSNPNDLQTIDHGSYRKPSIRKVPESPKAEARAVGIMSVPKPESTDQSYRGIRSSGSTHQCMRDASPTGLRAPLAPVNEFSSFRQESSPMGLPRRSSMGARGIKTFLPESSPNDDYFGMSLKSPRSSFVRRDSLVASSGLPSPSLGPSRHQSSLSYRQARTPFAVDE